MAMFTFLPRSRYLTSTTLLSLLVLCLGVSKVYGQEKEPLNFLMITCEDISPYLSFYGDSLAQTPNLDQLAKEGLVFDNAFATVGVCAPSRSSIITGMHPISIGTHHMRTGKDVMGWGQRDYRENTREIPPHSAVPNYARVLSSEVQAFTSYLRKAGYFCSNNSKTDYQFASPLSAWDENGPEAHFKNRKEGQAFFSVFNLGVTHESQIWKRMKDTMRTDPSAVRLPSYWPDTDSVRQDLARNYSNIALMDRQVGALIESLKAEGLYDNTVIFFFSDHGGPLPRAKRAIYDSGLKVPFLVRIPHSSRAGRSDRLISFVDIAPSVLSLAGLEAPKHMQGRAFLGKHTQEENSYIFGSADRFDEHYDRIRCVRNKRFMLVKNYYLDQPIYLDVAYRKQLASMRDILRLKAENKLDSIQMLWFNTPKAEFEFYDLETDPDQVNNLIGEAAYAEEIKKMEEALDHWLNEVGDLGEIPETTMLQEQWPNFKQPTTQKPLAERRGETIEASIQTQGADLVYKFSQSNQPIESLDHWEIYKGPIQIRKGTFLHLKSSRTGFADSETLILKL